MKRTKLIIAMVCLMCGCLETAAETMDTVEVSTCEEFKKALERSCYIQLKADINMKNYDDPVSVFKGEIDGWDEDEDGNLITHTITGLTECLADKMVGAVIRNVDFEDCQPCWHCWTDEGFGMLCHKSYDCEFKNIELRYIRVYYKNFWDHMYLAKHRFGGLLVGVDERSTFRNIQAEYSYVYVSDSEAGGLVGMSTGGTFSHILVNSSCVVHAQGKDDFFTAPSGGVVGRADACTFRSCTNFGTISSALDNVGGIVGQAEGGCTFDYCDNYGFILHQSISNATNIVCNASFSSIYELGFSLLPKFQNINTANYYKFVASEHAKWQAGVDKYADELATYKYKLIKQRHHLEDYQEEITWWKHRLDYNRDVDRIAYVNKQIKKNQDAYELQKTVKIKKPVDPDEPEPVADDAHKYNTGVLSYIMLALQVAQIVYEAQDQDNVGGIVGDMTGGGWLKACSNTGICISDDAYCGGIAGKASGSGLLIDCCLNEGAVKGYEQTGGIVGKICDGTIRGCLNTGNVSKGNSGYSSFGRIYGEKSSGVSAVGNCHAGNKTESESTAQRMMSQQALASGETALYLNEKAGGSYWRQTLGENRQPTLDSLSNVVSAADVSQACDTVYQVGSVISLMSALTNQYANIKITKDIQVNSDIFNRSSGYMPFHGTIDGQGHKISYITHSLSSKENKLLGNDNEEGCTGLFTYAENATFKDLTLDNIIVNIGAGKAEYVALLVAHSKHCMYKNVHLTGESAVQSWNDGYANNVGGLIAHSEGDSLVDCTTGSACHLKNLSGKLGTFYTRPVGGLVAVAKGSTFIRCHNAATVLGDGTDYAGGILAKDEGGSKLMCCLNTGAITAEEYVGGLVGYGKNTNLSHSVNTGIVKSSDEEDNVGGIGGELEKATLNVCYNFGTIVDTGSDNNTGALIGENEGCKTTECLYYCTANGKQITNTDKVEELKNGEWVCLYLNTINPDTVKWYQALDDNYNYPTHFPVPISDAGTVYYNGLCDGQGTIAYSNRYHAVRNHTPNPSSVGVCQECGYTVSLPASDAVIDIATTTDLIDFANLVNSNKDYSALSARLVNDIDLEGCYFPMIGSSSIPYCGTFNGRNHRIKNMNVEVDGSDSYGFFACLGNGAEIDSLVIDSTSSITTAGLGVAGIAGCVKSTSGTTCNVTIHHCGNEAAITGVKNVAGILGGVYNNDKTVLTITECYNTGTITGTSESASLCGYARKNYTISNCYNTGLLAGVDGTNYFYRNESSGTHSVTNCYDILGAQGTGVEKITTDQVSSGELCYKLNGSDNTKPTLNGFYQNLDSTNAHPCFEAYDSLIVMTYTKNFCTGKTTAAYYNPYNYKDVDYTKAVHVFDEEGFCYSVSGETHYEEPDTVHQGNTIVYQLKNAGNLYWVAEQVNSGEDYPNCDLMNDIVVNEDVAGHIRNADYSNLRKWTPIGVEGHPYQSAYFDGKGHTISGLYYVGSGDCIGLFGLAYNSATIRNLGVTDCYFWGGNAVGAIIGWGGKSYTDQSTWSDTNGPALFTCYSTGTIKGDNYLGGLAGFINNGSESYDKLSYLFSRASVGSTTHSGSLFGYIGTSTADVAYSDTLYHCYFRHDLMDNHYPCHVGTPMTSADFSYGKVCQLLNDAQSTDSIIWKQDIASQQSPVFGSESVKYSREVDDTVRWGTITLPFTVYSDTTITFYEPSVLRISNDGTTAKVTLKQVDKVAPNTPAIFCTNKDTTLVEFFSDGREVSVPTEWSDSAKYTLDDQAFTLVATHGDQILKKGEGFISFGTAMWNRDSLSSDVIVPEYRAYLYAPGLTGVKALCMQYVGSNYDLNADGEEDELDVNMLRDALAGKETQLTIDINKDQQFTISDITSFINALNNPTYVAPSAPSATTIYGR